jgi:alpha-ketoglutarate-dependent taurine dioxygenase
MAAVNIFTSEQMLPLVVEALPGNGAGPETLLHCYQDNFDLIESKLLERGAVLFRGFGIDQQEVFQQTVRSSLFGRMLDYVDGNSPRTKVTSGVYTSTEYPPEFFISMHNELSYSERWPARLFFCCVVAPEEGGETPLADSRTILSGMSPELANEFTQKGVKYIRNLHGGRGYGPSWQKTFETEDRTAVEEYCKDSGMQFEWKPDGGVRLWHVRPATAAHPKTGEAVWFNQADQFHPSTHPPKIYESLKALYRGKETQMPQNAVFGDDTRIEDWMLDEVRETVKKEIRLFTWQQGDFLMVDNMLVCHGRMPFKGRRKILVSMTNN